MLALEFGHAGGEERGEPGWHRKPHADATRRDELADRAHRVLHLLDERQDGLAERSEREPLRPAQHERCPERLLERREATPHRRVLDLQAARCPGECAGTCRRQQVA